VVDAPLRRGIIEQMLEMQKERYTLPYPRRRVARSIARMAGRLVLPIVFRVHVSGTHNFPRTGPLLVVGNHVAVMEAVLMAVYTPWQVETLGAADVPHEKVSEVAMRFYGFIPVRRGHVDRPALSKALDVLRQGGVIGIFPEGGIWEAGKMRPQTGVAWLSCRGDAPVLPIGYGGTAGALGAALRLRRPRLTMKVGELLPAVSLRPGMARREYLEKYATEVMEAVAALVPAEERRQPSRIEREQFELEVKVGGAGGGWESPAEGVEIEHKAGLARLLHSPGILKVFRKNLRMEVGALQDIVSADNAQEIADAAASVLGYLEGENPYFLAYRFGPRDAEEMQAGLEELLELAKWAAQSGYSLKLKPIRRYYSAAEEREIVQTRQGRFEDWM
jgi:1-acyl-sn-glycerol-3-phosphate acyltransferase